MTRFDLDPDLERLGEALHASTTIDLARKERAPQRRPRPRPRVLAGSTLGLAGVGAALTLALSAAGSPPAFAITRNGDGSVLVTIDEQQALPQANQRLTAMGIHERVMIYMAAGPAAVAGPVACTPAPGENLSGPQLRVLVGANGTEVIAPGQSGGNTGEGTYHLDRCVVIQDRGSGVIAGDTGAG